MRMHDSGLPHKHRMLGARQQPNLCGAPFKVLTSGGRWHAGSYHRHTYGGAGGGNKAERTMAPKKETATVRHTAAVAAHVPLRR